MNAHVLLSILHTRACISCGAIKLVQLSGRNCSRAARVSRSAIIFAAGKTYVVPEKL